MVLATQMSLTALIPKIAHRNCNLKRLLSVSAPPFIRFSRRFPENDRLVCAAASAAGSSSLDSDLNPYKLLGVSPFEGFDKVRAAYTKRQKEAESVGDEATAAQLENAYDKLMMSQLMSRKKGMAYGSFKVSKDIKYADRQPIVPWGPRFCWVLIKHNADYKPFQFLAFAFIYRIFEKLKSFEPPVSPTYTEDGEDDGQALRMGKWLLRSLALVFGCIAFASLAYTGILNLIEFLGSYIPVSFTIIRNC